MIFSFSVPASVCCVWLVSAFHLLYSFHAAMQVTDYKLLVHGGCSASGALKDAFNFNLGEFIQCNVTSDGGGGVHWPQSVISCRQTRQNLIHLEPKIYQSGVPPVF